jgi:hypothetical protein
MSLLLCGGKRGGGSFGRENWDTCRIVDDEFDERLLVACVAHLLVLRNFRVADLHHSQKLHYFQRLSSCKIGG